MQSFDFTSIKVLITEILEITEKQKGVRKKITHSPVRQRQTLTAQDYISFLFF